MRLVKTNRQTEAARFDMIAAQTLLVLYAGLNTWFISQAAAK
jgi:hypothetical protein